MFPSEPQTGEKGSASQVEDFGHPFSALRSLTQKDIGTSKTCFLWNQRVGVRTECAICIGLGKTGF